MYSIYEKRYNEIFEVARLNYLQQKMEQNEKAVVAQEEVGHQVKHSMEQILSKYQAKKMVQNSNLLILVRTPCNFPSWHPIRQRLQLL